MLRLPNCRNQKSTEATFGFIMWLNRWRRTHEILFDLLRGLTVVVAVSFLIAMLEYYGSFAGLDGRFQDWFWLSHGKDLNAQNIVVLEIDQDAYKDLFNSQSPLDPYILMSLVRQVSEAEPAILGVDVLTTSESDHGAAYRAFADSIDSDGLRAKTVWVADERRLRTHSPNPFYWLLGENEETIIEPTEVLGLPLRTLNKRPAILWGPALYPSDRDQKVRRFPTSIKVSEDIECRSCAWAKDSFARVVAKEYCSDCKWLTEDEIYLSISGAAPTHYNLSDIFEPGSQSKLKLKFPWARKLKDIAGGKVVLIGGTFGRTDSHETAEGSTYGVYTHARAIAAELSHFGYREIPQPASFMIDVIFGAIAVLIFAFLKRTNNARNMLRRSALSVFILTFFALSVWYFKGFLTSIPAVVTAAVIQQLYDFWHDNPTKPEQQHSS
jgi:hypothetical protein